ncbi:Sec-independent protein translocase protein TatB [Terrarubrum flagellatum]|uniref:Sec-independent protein translocase protein TatB n=1 Tax=Terrirubrum flagellatum TaxID=2895980 RepID=UPI00314524C7
MFDISWGEMMLIGAAALIFIGPKELPATLRALGQMTAKVRRMAGEFRSQFDEAMREADVQSIRKEFDSMNDAASSTSNFNPIQTIRDEIKGAAEKRGEMDRPSDLAPAEAAPAPMETAAADPILPTPEPPAPIEASSFEIAPALSEPVVASAPQPAPRPAGAIASIDASPPKRAVAQKDPA